MVDNFNDLILPDPGPSPEWYREAALELGLGLELEIGPGVIITRALTVPLTPGRPPAVMRELGLEDPDAPVPLWPCPAVADTLEDTLNCPHGYAWTPGVGWLHT
jgi:hypothetical protein